MCATYPILLRLWKPLEGKLVQTIKTCKGVQLSKITGKRQVIVNEKVHFTNEEQVDKYEKSAKIVPYQKSDDPQLRQSFLSRWICLMPYFLKDCKIRKSKNNL